MPYELRGKCVYKTGESEPLKCHDTDEQARAHLMALNMNVDESIRIVTEAKITLTDDPTGREWEVTVIGPKNPGDIVVIGGQEYLRSQNDRLYAIEGLRQSVPQWDGAQVYDNHLTQQEFEEKDGMRSPLKEWLGAIVKPFWDEAAKSVKGFFRIADDTAVKKFKNAFDLGILKTIGLSIDTIPVQAGTATLEGRTLPLYNGFKTIFSLDVVGRPAAGGSFDRVIAANNKSQLVEAIAMEDEAKQLEKDRIQALEEKLAALEETLAAKNQPETEAEEVVAPDKAGTGEAPAEAQPEQPNNDAAEQAAKEARLARCELLLERKLNAAKLPDAFRKIVEGQFAGLVFEEKALDAAIKRVKEAQAATDTSGRVSEASGQIQPGLDRDDKFAIEFARLMMGNADFNRVFGADKVDPMIEARLKESDHWLAWKKDGGKDLRSFSRLSTLIEEWAGGNPLFDQRAMETASTSSLATVVKNTVNIMVAADYSLQQRWYEPLVKIEEVDTIDDATLARLFGVNTLSVVAEGDAYTELALVDEEETASFVKKGNYIGITMETLMRDKINYVRTIPRRLSDTWYNTLSALVAGVFTVNSATGPVLSTTGALFNANATSSAGGHANLLTAALSFTNFGAARTAMRAQTNQALGAGRKMLISPRYLLVPNDLETTALQIRNSENLPGSGNNDINPYYQQFDVVVVPDWTDANNWALMGDPMRFPAIFLIFPRGAMTPQLFTADNEATGAMFTNDTLRYKIRMLTYRFSSTYECAPVADFRPLHKNNVA